MGDGFVSHYSVEGDKVRVVRRGCGDGVVTYALTADDLAHDIELLQRQVATNPKAVLIPKVLAELRGALAFLRQNTIRGRMMGAQRVSLTVYRVHGKDYRRGESFDFRLEVGRDAYDYIDWPVNEPFVLVPRRPDLAPELLRACKAAYQWMKNAFEGTPTEPSCMAFLEAVITKAENGPVEGGE